jgi:hypothetical protein
MIAKISLIESYALSLVMMTSFCLDKKLGFSMVKPNPDKPEPNRFEDKRIDCVSEFSARKNTKIIC